MYKQFQIFPLKILRICIFVGTILLITAQCSSTNLPPTPELPTTPDSPPLSIAILSPATGELEIFGRQLRNGIFLAIDEINQTGGVFGHIIEWQIYDTACDFEIAQEMAQQVIDDGHLFVIGPLCSEAALGAVSIFENHAILMLTPTGTHPQITRDPTNKTRSKIFSIAHDLPSQGQVAAKFAYTHLNIQQAAILADPVDSYDRFVADGFRETFEASGGEIVYKASYPRDTSDMVAQFSEITKAGVEAIYLPAPPFIVHHVINEFNAYQATSGGQNDLIFIGSDRWGEDALDFDVARGQYFLDHFWLSDTNDFAQAWTATYRATYAIEPDTLSVLGYDAMFVLLQALEQVGSKDPNVIAEALATSTFAGLTGPISFDDQNSPIKPVPILQVQDGQVELSVEITPNQ